MDYLDFAADDPGVLRARTWGGLRHRAERWHTAQKAVDYAGVIQDMLARHDGHYRTRESLVETSESGEYAL